MNVLAAIGTQGHEQVIAFRNGPSGLRGFLAIHSTALGPAFGGVRLMRYRREADAFADALRLSRGMTYKCALAGLPAGGGKAVILDHPKLEREAAFEAFGRVVDSLGGRFFTGGDVGIQPSDLACVRRATSYVACESSPALGDINEHTATGVWHAMRGCLEHAGLEAKGARVAIQGVGNVGAWLARILAREGCALAIADTDARAAKKVAKETGARVVPPARILSVDCEVLAPCALGGILNARTIPKLECRIVCGAANNQLATPADGDRLARRGILYAPDYLANAGGVLRGVEFYLLGRGESWESLERQRDRMLEVARAAGKRRSTARVADAMAEARFSVES
jgi:leucine dehydrogenase